MQQLGLALLTLYSVRSNGRKQNTASTTTDLEASDSLNLLYVDKNQNGFDNVVETWVSLWLRPIWAQQQLWVREFDWRMRSLPDINQSAH